MSENIVIQVKKRPWYEWVLWALWGITSLFLLESATASGAELEPRAAMIFWVSLVVWVLAGIVVWFIRRNK